MKWQPLQKHELQTENTSVLPPVPVKHRPIRKFVEEIGLAFALLTRFRIPTFQIRSSATYASAFWAFPIVGAVVGVMAATVFWLCMTVGLSIVVSAILTVTAMILMCGGLHEDGFSDFWDGIGGGRTRERKLAIMRDSRQGAYGALAVALMLALQIVLLTDIYIRGGISACLTVLVASEAAARGAIAIPCLVIKPARGDGLGTVMQSAGKSTLWIGLMIGAAIALVLMLQIGIVLIIGALAGAGVIAALAARHLGGFTGDVLGATVVMARLSGLCFAAAAL